MTPLRLVGSACRYGSLQIEVWRRTLRERHRNEIALEMRVDDKHFRWTAVGGSTGEDAFSVGLSLSRAGRELGKLRLGWSNGRTSFDDDEEKDLDRLVVKLSSAVARLVEPGAGVGAATDPSGNVVPLRR